jgi:hypothetical protein
MTIDALLAIGLGVAVAIPLLLCVRLLWEDWQARITPQHVPVPAQRLKSSNGRDVRDRGS